MQLEVIDDGPTNADIAAQPDITPRTVANQVVQIKARLGVGSRAAFITCAHRAGLAE